MANTPKITSSTFTAKNIASGPTTLATYTAATDGLLQFRIDLSSLNGAAANITIEIDATATDGSTALGSPVPGDQWAKASATATVTTIQYGPFMTLAGQVYTISATSSNASDTSVAGALYVFNGGWADVGATGGTAFTGVDVPANLVEWLGSTPNALVSGNVPAQVNAYTTARLTMQGGLTIGGAAVGSTAALLVLGPNNEEGDTDTPAARFQAYQWDANGIEIVSGNVNQGTPAGLYINGDAFGVWAFSNGDGAFNTDFMLGQDTSGVTPGMIFSSISSVSGDVVGNVDGSVASVTGAVGSVTGNVDGNVSGTVTLAGSQPNYAPSKAGDQMDLVNSPNTTAVTAIATAVWAAGARTLTSLGTVVSDTASAVWSATTRTLSAFGFTVDTNANSTETAIKAQTDLIGTNDADSPAAQTAQSTISTNLDAKVSDAKSSADSAATDASSAATAASAAQTAAEALPDADDIATAVGAQITSDHGEGSYTGGGGGGGGAGQYPVNQDGGAGAGGAAVQVATPYTGSLVDCSPGCMTFTNAASVGISGLLLCAYLASDYDNNVRSILAQTYTDSSGNWVASLNLNSGTYYLLANPQGDGYQAAQIKIVVP